MKNLLFFFALLAQMVMTVPQANAAGPPDRLNEIVLSVDHTVTDFSIVQVAVFQDVTFAADLPVLFIHKTDNLCMEKLYLTDNISFKHPPNDRVDLMLSTTLKYNDDNKFLIALVRKSRHDN
jgi:hypothetical protein